MFSKKPKVLSREEVYRVIDSEAEFAKQFDPGVSRAPQHIADKDKPLEQWLMLMEGYFNRAKERATIGFDRAGALEDLRIVLSLGVNAAMYHNIQEREYFKVRIKSDE